MVFQPASVLPIERGLNQPVFSSTSAELARKKKYWGKPSGFL
jgi:hypothetical protein